MVWEATDRLCSRRLHRFLPEVVKILGRHGHRSMTAEIEAELCWISPSIIARLLHPYRRPEGRRSFATTKTGSLLKNATPIKAFADWQDDRPGFLEIDLISHCDEGDEGDEAGGQDKA